RPFVGAGWIRLIYYPMLLSHIVLAAAIVPLALTTVYRALQGNFARHVRIARWTLPIWLYVSVTGVLVYWMLYRLCASDRDRARQTAPDDATARGPGRPSRPSRPPCSRR